MGKTLKKINDMSHKSNRKNFEQGLVILKTQLNVIERNVPESIKKEIQDQFQY